MRHYNNTETWRITIKRFQATFVIGRNDRRRWVVVVSYWAVSDSTESRNQVIVDSPLGDVRDMDGKAPVLHIMYIRPTFCILYYLCLCYHIAAPPTQPRPMLFTHSLYLWQESQGSRALKICGHGNHSVSRVKTECALKTSSTFTSHKSYISQVISVNILVENETEPLNVSRKESFWVRFENLLKKTLLLNSFWAEITFLFNNNGQ